MVTFFSVSFHWILLSKVFDRETLTIMQFGTPLNISIPENCTTNRKVRVRLARTVSSGHLSKEYTHVS